MRHPTCLAPSLLTMLAFAACTPTSTLPPLEPTADPTPVPIAPVTSEAGPSAEAEPAAAEPVRRASDEPTQCTASQFVPCESGQACATRQGKLVEAKPCHDHAASACAALSCQHGCNIHHGTPKQVFCAINASGSSNMKRCGGFSNWACPEDMTCEPDHPHGFDVMGTCVRARL